MPIPDFEPASSSGPEPGVWLAIALALLGRWVHAFAQAWLMFSLTGSALWLAAAAAVAALSALPVVLWSGTRGASGSPWRRLAFAHGGLILVALACAVLLLGQRLAPWQLLVAAAAYGGLAALESPALAAVVGAAGSVARRQVSAARHALLFNGMRALAPMLAAALIAVAGAAACFVFNAACLLPMLALARRSRFSRRPVDEPPPATAGERLRPMSWLASAAVFSALVLPVAALLPAISHEIGGDPLAVLSRLSSGLGAGAFGAALLLCRWRPIGAVRGGQVLAGMALLATPGLTLPEQQLVWSVALGASISGVLGLCVSGLQGVRERRKRAQALAGYAAIQLGLTPLAVVATAALTEAFGAMPVLQGAGALLFVYAVAGRGWQTARARPIEGVVFGQKFSSR